MASGDTLFILTPMSGTPPATLYATLDTLAITGATPDSYIPVLDFDGGTAIESMDWFLSMPSHYIGTTGITFKAYYAMDGASANPVRLEYRAIAFAEDDALPTARVIDTQTSTDDVDTPVSATTNDLSIGSPVAMAKANFGSPSAGDLIQIRLTRDPVDAGDTNTNDLQLIKIVVTET